jgi:hypothetical protein
MSKNTPNYSNYPIYDELLMELSDDYIITRNRAVVSSYIEEYNTLYPRVEAELKAKGYELPHPLRSFFPEPES